jgi:hypothetical protein
MEPKLAKIVTKYKVLARNKVQMFRLKGLPYRELGIINVNALKNTSNIKSLWALMKEEIPRDR